MPRPATSLKVGELSKPFNGLEGEDLDQWLKRFDLVCGILGVTTKAKYLPLMTSGYDFVVYD